MIANSPLMQRYINSLLRRSIDDYSYWTVVDEKNCMSISANDESVIRDRYQNEDNWTHLIHAGEIVYERKATSSAIS